MAGLPGTGKSTLAARLAAELGGVVLGKDAVRSALFPPPTLDYSREQDDVSMAAIYSAAAYSLRSNPAAVVLIDGRTFLRSYQIRDLVALAGSVGQTPRVIECVCDDETIRRRLENDLEEGVHPARNRTFDMYLSLKAAAEPIPLPRLVLDTGAAALAECVEHALDYLGCT
jgi:adenylylsulfate kinase